ncbi:MAG: hypothetical protein ABIG31_01325 [Candidatus Omnitrophota bacterium]
MGSVYSDNVKQKVCALRRQGWTLGEISLKTRIPKHTISSWVKDIKLTSAQKKRIEQKILDSGAIGRPLAAMLMRRKIEEWKNDIRRKVRYFEKLPLRNSDIGKLVCALLYLCEGAKYPASRYLYFGNSDSKVIYFFINLLRKTYSINEGNYVLVLVIVVIKIIKH